MSAAQQAQRAAEAKAAELKELLEREKQDCARKLAEQQNMLLATELPKMASQHQAEVWGGVGCHVVTVSRRCN